MTIRMFKYTIIVIFLFLSFLMSNATTYYVNTNGNDSDNGLTESTAFRTIYHAGQIANDGDTVYIKAGVYKKDKLNIAHSASEEAPIVFEGYQKTPGDNPQLNYQLGDKLDPTLMPILDGLDRSINTAIVSSYRDYIEIRNLQITNYELGIYIANSNNNIIENIITVNLGDINDSYSGVGIDIYKGGSNTFRNCIVVNAAAEGIGIVYSDSNLLENCQVYCDDATNVNAGTDYYLHIYGNYNTIRGCYIERVGNLEHVGHGMGIKGNGEHNLFENCTARNLAGGGFYVRHRGVKNNIFRNCTAYEATGFLIRDGASYNNFYNCKAIDCQSAARFLDTSEDGGAQYAGRYNNFFNCLFENSHVAIDFHPYDRNSDANDNRFINCVVSGGDYLFSTERTNYDNEMINCIISSVSEYKTGSYDLRFNFINTDFWNNGFSSPAGVDVYAFNPMFANVAHGDYRLAGGSPCVDAGIKDTTGLHLPDTDAYGNDRIADGNNDGARVIDLGLYEYDGVSQPPGYIGPHFVSIDGNDSNDGVSETTAWRTITHAAQKAQPGDIIYVKAGNYGDENIVFANSGTKDAPIVLEGYQNIPGDHPRLEYNLGDEPNPQVLPLLDGGNRTVGCAINLENKRNIQLRNIQITNYEIAISLYNANKSGFNIIDNVIASNLGDIDDSYSGKAFLLENTKNNVLKNCIAVNAAAEGISLAGSDSNTVENCEVYCNDATNGNAGTDYYLYVGGSSNKIRNCYIERVGNLEHGGHGIGVKGNGENNVFEDCKAVNIAGGGFYVRHRGAKYNLFKNCTSVRGAGFMLRDGAAYNRFVNCNADSCYESIVFLDTSEDDGAQFAGRYNDFYNCLFENSNYVINFCQYNINSDADNNRFINCVFNKGNYLFRSLRTNYDNEMINCIVTNITGFKSAESGEYELNFNFSYSDFWENGFSAPSGINLLEEDPQFVDAENSDFHLNETSPCIDAGTPDTTGLALPALDADGKKRIADGTSIGTAVIDMGRYEYPDSLSRLNFALSFNTKEGKTDELITADGFADTGENFTMEVWFQIASIPNSGEEYHIISFWDGGYNMQTQLYVNSAGKISTQGSAGAAGIEGSTILATNHWYHLAYVRTPTSINIYLDGVPEAAKTDGSDGGAFQYLVLGRFRGFDDEYDFTALHGVLDEVRIWNYARSETEIYEDKNKALSGTEYGLVAYYNFNEGSGTVIQDLTGHGHTGNMLNMDYSNWVEGVPLNETAIKGKSILPQRIFLMQNFPNPFNPQTTISFGLPQPGFVELFVYNILGEKVAELVKSKMPAGRHKVRFNGAALPSGVYFYRISTRKFTEVKKMMLIK